MVVTHEMGFAREVADRVLLDLAKIVEEDTPSALFSAPKHTRTRNFFKIL